MNPIALGQPVAYDSTLGRPPSSIASAPQAHASADDLRAEHDALEASVGALGTLARGFAAAPVAPANPTPTPISSLPPLSSSSSSSSSASAFTPARSWTSMLGQSGSGSAPPGSAADQGMSQILDSGDVFDGG